MGIGQAISPGARVDAKTVPGPGAHARTLWQQRQLRRPHLSTDPRPRHVDARRGAVPGGVAAVPGRGQQARGPHAVDEGAHQAAAKVMDGQAHRAADVEAQG